ncbi:MAG: hypothetical protein AAFN16_01950 [Pseudomonadota bacterium]
MKIALTSIRNMRTYIASVSMTLKTVSSELERVGLVDGLKDQIEEARDRVAHFRLRAERPCARLEDAYALEKARTRLLTLELKSLRWQVKTNEQSGKGRRGRVEKQGTQSTGNPGLSKIMRTKHKHLSLNARERAEASFAALKKRSETPEEC